MIDTTNLLIFIGALAILIVSGSIMIKTLAKIASYIHLSEYVIGFIILAFATSLPELFVGISSALNHTPEVIIGTVIGSNIANLTIIIGIPILLAQGIKIHSKKTKNDALWMIGLAVLPLILMVIGNSISRFDGVVLLIAFTTYLLKLIREGKQFSKEIKEGISHKMIVFSVFLFVISLFLLYKSSDYVVKYATIISSDIGIAPLMIGLFMVAIGTSLPELVSGISAVLQKHDEMSVGNIIGSVISNSTLVIGISAIIYPIGTSLVPFIISSTFLVVVGIIFTAFVEEGNDMSWIEGLSLVMLYVFFLMVEFYLQGGLA